ncbi:hypothetical protein TWF192_002715 [Orbilia oligospora]|uniref:Uncharacterized protein n=1 Tax=Orbilia oligospora TaxID=2813651 RepID=A0A6G1MGN6_ORBOL|nr:hypothetical protein TWF191_005240 [Orbilia oligospora]KAF3255360.1 hypothetical protein TWF192_002715 [Orbilia oligospora]
MDLDAKAVMRFRVFIAQENFDSVSRGVSKHRATFLQDASYFQHPLRFQRHDRILVPLDNMCYDCPVGINERTGEVGNLCLDRVTPAEGIQQFRIHGVFKEYGTTEPIKTSNVNHHNSNIEEFPPANLYEPRWQFHYGDPFLLRPDFNLTNSGQRDVEGIRKVNVFNLRTGEPLSVPLTKIRLHANYKFKGSEIRGSQKGIGSLGTQFYTGQLLTVAVLGGRNVRLGGRTTRSLLFCLATGTGAPSWVLENQLEPLDRDFMSFANHTTHWLISDMEDETQDDLQGLGLQDLNLQVVYANFRNSANPNGSRANYLQGQVFRGYDSDLEDAPHSEHESEDGDIQSRGRQPPAPSCSRNDMGNSRGRRDGRIVLQRTRQSPVGSEIHELRRAHLDPSSQGIRIDSTPVQPESNVNIQRGRNPTSRSPHHPLHPEERMGRPRGPRSSHLAPPPNHLEFLGDRLEEESERYNGMDFARYSSRERDPHDDESVRGDSPHGSNQDRYDEAFAYMRFGGPGPAAEPMDRENSNLQYQRNHPRRSPPVGDGY